LNRRGRSAVEIGRPAGHLKESRVKFLVLPKDDPETLRTPPSPERMAAIGTFMQDAAKAGAIYLAGGIRPSEASTQVTYSAGKRTVLDGPYAEAKELVAGFAIVDAASLDDAIEWVSRFADVAGVGTIEIREVFIYQVAPGTQAEEAQGR
jgi:hypothetical protein